MGNSPYIVKEERIPLQEYYMRKHYEEIISSDIWEGEKPTSAMNHLKEANF